MSTAVIYYGAPSSSPTQKVSEALRLRGINLIRSSPSKVEPVAIRLIVAPTYDIYKENFHVAAHSAKNKLPIPISDANLFIPYEGKRNLPFCERFRVVWGVNGMLPAWDQVAIDVMRAKYQPAEISIHGKPAFIADLTIASVASLIKLRPNLTTATISGAINLAGAMGAIKMSRIAMGFLTTHQYPLCQGKDKLDSVFRTGFAIEQAALQEREIEMEDDQGVSKMEKYAVAGPTESSTYVFHMNGITDPAAFNPIVGSKASLPNYPGFLFPFVQELAKADDGLVPQVIEDYFFGMLGGHKDVNSQVLMNLRSAWGVIKETEMGDCLAHLYSGIKIALESGGSLKIIYGTKYDGFVLSGSQFNLLFRGDLLEPASFQELQEAFDGALPHTIALNSIINLINWKDDAEKTLKTQSIPTIHALRKLLHEQGYLNTNEQAIRQHALLLAFPSQPYLSVNAHNVALILKAFTQSDSGDTQFPINPLYILSSNRRHRLWSAFGQYGPTFLIPGGQVMSLESANFSYKEKIKGSKVRQEHMVNRMHIQIVPIEKAILDLDTVLTKKDVHSPVGTQMARKASSVSLFREFAGPAGTEVLAALRLACGIVHSAPSELQKKRKAEEALEHLSKRMRTADAFMEDI